MQKKQSTILNANIMGMLLMYLFPWIQKLSSKKGSMAHRLKNHGREATES